MHQEHHKPHHRANKKTLESVLAVMEALRDAPGGQLLLSEAMYYFYHSASEEDGRVWYASGVCRDMLHYSPVVLLSLHAPGEDNSSSTMERMIMKQPLQAVSCVQPVTVELSSQIVETSVNDGQLAFGKVQVAHDRWC